MEWREKLGPIHPPQSLEQFCNFVRPLVPSSGRTVIDLRRIGCKEFVWYRASSFKPMKFYHPFGTSIVVCLLAALFLRYSLIDFQTADYTYYLSPWYDFITNNGYVYALNTKFADYTPPYLYLLVLASLSGLPKIVAIKLIPVIFDFYFPCHFYIPVVIGMSSFFAYFPYLFGSHHALLPYLAFALLAVIIILGREFLISCRSIHGRGAP